MPGAQIINRFYRLFRIQPEEAGFVSLNVLFALFIGLSQTFLTIIPLAIFLGKYSSSFLTYVYMSMGLISFLVGSLLKPIQKKLSFFSFFLFLLSSLFFSLLLIFAAFQLTSFAWIPMSLFIWANVSYTLLSLAFSSLNIHLFTLQEGKRLLGIIGAAKALGGIIAGFATPILIKVFPFNTVTLFAPFTLLPPLYFLFLLKQRHTDRLIETERSEPAHTSFKNLSNKKYILCIFLVNVVSLFTYYSIDLLFNTEVKAHFLDEAKIAEFLGFFSVLTQSFTLIGGLFLFGWLLDKLGLIATLFFIPATVGSLIALTLFSTLFPISIAFYLLLGTTLLERTLRLSIQGGAIALLYQPLSLFEKEWVQLQYRSSVQPIASALIGAILWLFSHTLGIHIYDIGSFVLAVSLCGLATLSLVKRNYVKTFISALSKRNLVKPNFTQLDSDSLKILTDHLKSPYPAEVIYVLQTIETAEPKAFPKALLEALDSPLPEVRRYCFQRLEQNPIQEEKVARICLQEKDPQTLGYALRALGSLGKLEQIPSFNSPDCLIAAFLYGSPSLKKEAIEQLTTFLQSTDESKRLIGITALKSIDIPGKKEFLLKALIDPSLEVRRIACEAANSHDERIDSLLIENLTIPHLHQPALKALLKQTPVDFLLKQFHTCSHAEQIHLLNLFASLEHDALPPFLQQFLTTDDRSLLYPALQALKKDSPLLRSLLLSERDRILSLRELVSHLSVDPLRSLLNREIEWTQSCCFQILSLLYPGDVIAKAKEGCFSKDRNRISLATEILLQTLTKEEAKTLLPQLLPTTATLQERPLTDLLPQLIPHTANAYINSLSSVILYTIGKMNLKELTDLVQKTEAPNDPYLIETRTWALEKLAESR